MTPNSDLQFINKESGNSMTTAKLQSARLLPHWCGSMQRDLDALMDWGSTWGMKFNAKKCNIMRVSRSRKPLQHFYSLGNEILQEVSDAKYLGIQIDNKLDWNKHISTVAARGQSKLAFLNRNLKGCPKKLRDTAYISLIRPALEYSCSVWHPHKK